MVSKIPSSYERQQLYAVELVLVGEGCQGRYVLRAWSLRLAASSSGFPMSGPGEAGLLVPLPASRCPDAKP